MVAPVGHHPAGILIEAGGDVFIRWLAGAAVLGVMGLVAAIICETSEGECVDSAMVFVVLFVIWVVIGGFMALVIQESRPISRWDDEHPEDDPRRPPSPEPQVRG